MQAAIARGRALDKWSGRFSEIVGNMPTSYFGIVLGLAGLGNAWRGAERTWQLPKFIEDWIYLIAGAVWAVLVAIYVLKALLMPDKLPAVVTHSFQCCCIGLAGVATMLVAGGLAPDARTSACVVFGIGFASTLFFAVGPTAASRVADIGKMFDALQRAEPRQPERPESKTLEETRMANQSNVPVARPSERKPHVTRKFPCGLHEYCGEHRAGKAAALADVPHLDVGADLGGHSERSKYVKVAEAGPGERNDDPGDAINSKAPLHKLFGSITQSDLHPFRCRRSRSTQTPAADVEAAGVQRRRAQGDAVDFARGLH